MIQAHTTYPLAKVMLMVVVAMLPGIVSSVWLISPLIIFNIIFCVLLALATEALCLWLRKHPVGPALSDGSILVAATILALAIPPQLPFWQLGLGVIAMVVLGKHLYGGLGQNIFNPAMVGFAFLMVSFPQSMVTWLDASQHSLSVVNLLAIKCSLSLPAVWDTITQATPLESIRAASLYAANESATISQSLLEQKILQSPWPVINFSFFAGGVWLLYTRIISWHIPVSIIATLFVLHGMLDAASTQAQIPASLAIFSGATMLGAFFVATDPVTATSTRLGHIIYGTGIGGLTFVIREWGGYPEGFAFAVLLMNMAAPLIDLLLNRHATA